MAYRDNVNLLCDQMGVPNPIREDDIKVDKIYFIPIAGLSWVMLNPRK